MNRSETVVENKLNNKKKCDLKSHFNFVDNFSELTLSYIKVY